MSYFCEDTIEETTTETLMAESMQKLYVLDLALLGVKEAYYPLEADRCDALHIHCFETTMMFEEVNKRLQGASKPELKLAA